MNKHGETIVLKVNKDKCLAGFYALGFEPTGTMIFKWNEEQIPIKEVFKAFGQQPILGDMKSKTKWSVFIKNAKAVQS
ncbi:hypothetical protein ACSX1G_06300 [Limosilactobacillus reuteri]|uniref:hypothetical protein n=1 Tax=Limosilactobacillus reuteri TaxID=1598 RepID=UPI003F685492